MIAYYVGLACIATMAALSLPEAIGGIRYGIAYLRQVRR